MINQKYAVFSAVVPAYNEAKRFPKVLKELLKINNLGELIFVDDGSTDETEATIKKFSDPRLKYIRHSQNKGKGAALKTGVHAAKNKVILFLDADLRNITATKIMKITKPVLLEAVDLSRGKFHRTRGRVTEYAVKPLMKILFPEVYFEQPISGQICGKRDFLKGLDYESKYGVDIGILFDAIESGQRIIEVDIGKIEHRANSEEDIAEMSRQVLETMIKKAGLIQHKYKLVVFTLDNTLVRKDTLEYVFEKQGRLSQYSQLKSKFLDSKLSFAEYADSIAKLFTGLSDDTIVSICNSIPLVDYAPEVINALKKRKYQVAIVSSSFSPIVVAIANRLGIDILDCIYLDRDEGGKYLGSISVASRERWLDHPLEESFKKGFIGITRKIGAKSSETIMVANSPKALPLINSAGLGVAFSPDGGVLKDEADKTINVLAELLAIVE
ncbi:MAG: HAD-IB family phosphatase [Patescibacteria group bacterium]